MLLILLFLFSGLSISVAIRPDRFWWIEPINYISLVLTLILSSLSVIFCWLKHDDNISIKLMGFFNRYIFFWIMLKAFLRILNLPPWLGKTTVMPPWNQNWRNSWTLLDSIEGGINVRLMWVFWCFFIGTLLTFAIPVIGSLILEIYDSLYSSIINPKEKHRKNLRQTIHFKDYTSALNILSFLTFLKRSLLFSILTIPLILTMTREKIELFTNGGFTISSGGFFVVILIPFLVGIGYFFENATVKIRSDSKKLAPNYFKYLIELSLISGILSITGTLRYIFTEIPSILSLVSLTIEVYLFIIATIIPIFVILTQQRKNITRLFNHAYSHMLGVLFIIFFIFWIMTTKKYKFPSFISIIQCSEWFPAGARWNPYFGYWVLISCLWILIPLINYLRRKKTLSSKLFVILGIALGLLFSGLIVLFTMEHPFIMADAFWRKVVLTFYIQMILLFIGENRYNIRI